VDRDRLRLVCRHPDNHSEKHSSLGAKLLSFILPASWISPSKHGGGGGGSTLNFIENTVDNYEDDETCVIM
jgi:hypothetical protein